jgi:hypothetical protein
MNTTSALEKRIAVALSSDITAANLVSLIAETETATPIKSPRLSAINCRRGHETSSGRTGC